MKTKIMWLFVIVFLATLTGALAGTVPVDTYDYGLDCYYPNSHFMKMDDGVLRVNCFTDTDNLSCTSKVYSMLDVNNYDEILQTNPDVVHSSRASPFFSPENNQLNVYFNKKNLLVGQDYLYSVECSGIDGVDVYKEYVNVTNNKLISNVAQNVINIKDNSAYYWMAFFGIIFIIIIIVILIGFFKNR